MEPEPKPSSELTDEERAARGWPPRIPADAPFSEAGIAKRKGTRKRRR
jgi:hypothetical protein